MDIVQLKKLPSPFYRCSVKAIILDDQGRLLIGRGNNDEIQGWEMPGGGWEYGESIEECLRREIKEELGAEIGEIGEVFATYRGRSRHGWMIVRIAVRVKLKNHDFKYGAMTEAKLVTREELMNIEFDAEEGTVKTIADKIWT
ncbi:MAG TPA: NUDIX hydrolase [Candidatus Saccharimonadales bacterium]|nr:NUDIX hydrolase [Candidatus Saccharimonadales bacterium]